MKAWSEGADRRPDQAGEHALEHARLHGTARPDDQAAALVADVADVAAAAAGSGDLRSGEHRHGDVVHAHDHPHPHHRTDPDGRPYIAIVGAGPVGTALGLALHRAGWPVAAVASRDPIRRERFRALVPDARDFPDAEAVLDEAELIFVCVPDDAIRPLAARLKLYSGQALVHTSGLLGADVLAPALAAGTQLGAFHPLVSFTADVERGAAALRGATIALEGDDQLVALLADIAEAVGGVPVRLPPGSKAAYHAAAVLAAGGLVALLDAIAELGQVAGLDERASLAIFGRLVEQTLGNARELGVRAALTGPIVRGDEGTLAAHLGALRDYAPGVLELYLAAARREIALGEERGSLAPDDAARLRARLAKGA